MKIVILDSKTANPGDLSWDFLNKFGEVTVYDRTSSDEVIPRSQGAEIVIVNKTVMKREHIEALPQLKLIALLATGYNVIDCDACKDKGVLVANIPAYSTNAVAQQTIAFILEFCNRIGQHSASVHSGDWVNSADFSYSVAPLYELGGKTIGIIGFGSIGRRVAELSAAFGMRVLVNTANPAKYADYKSVTFVDRNTLLSESDFVTIHCPMTPETDKMVNADFLSKMKKTAFLVNTSRGGEVDEQALADALNSGVIAGAGVDVLLTEPPKAENPLLHAKNIFITPHIAWSAYETRIRLMSILEGNIAGFVNGTPVNIVAGNK